jgi:hypothetical protein
MIKSASQVLTLSCKFNVTIHLIINCLLLACDDLSIGVCSKQDLVHSSEEGKQ